MVCKVRDMSRPTGPISFTVRNTYEQKCNEHKFLPVGVKQKALHNKDVSLLLFLLVRLWDDLSIQGVIDAMRLLKLHWVVQPCIDSTHHGVHVQSSKD